MSLLDAVSSALADPRLRSSDVSRNLETVVLHSKSRASHALFPWAAQIQTNPVHAQDLLILASEEGLPVVALEAAFYSLSNTSAHLLYISKVDSTGLHADRPSLARALSAACIAWHLQTHGPNTRIHIFAKAASQYLFPGSADNNSKRLLTDKQLMNWWKGTLDQVGTQVSGLQGWHAFPGLEEIEAKRVLPTEKTGSTIQWKYGHAFDLLSPLCSPNESLGDLVPAFPDDPKSRFLTSLTSSPINASGETGDYDDATRQNEPGFELQREKERLRLRGQNADEFWEKLAWRQECCSGVLVGFFLLAFREDVQAGSRPVTQPTLSYATYTKLWSAFHNVDYALVSTARPAEETKTTESSTAIVSTDTAVAIARISDKHSKWLADVKAAFRDKYEAISEAEYIRQTVLPKDAANKKRDASAVETVPPPVVMMLQPRKKLKPS